MRETWTCECTVELLQSLINKNSNCYSLNTELLRSPSGWHHMWDVSCIEYFLGSKVAFVHRAVLCILDMILLNLT